MWEITTLPGINTSRVLATSYIRRRRRFCIAILKFSFVCFFITSVNPTSNTEGDAISGSARWVRCPQIFEVTDRAHQDMTLNTNTLLGHYVWVIKAKRFDYYYQPGIDPECHMGDVGEETRTGLLSGYNQDQSADKAYPGNIKDESNTIWDYDGEDNVYGDY